MIDPNSPAFGGIIAKEMHVRCECGANMNGHETLTQSGGLPIRLHLAAMAMQGMLANSSAEMSNAPISQINATALMHADDLIEQYNRTEEKKDA